MSEGIAYGQQGENYVRRHSLRTAGGRIISEGIAYGQQDAALPHATEAARELRRARAEQLRANSVLPQDEFVVFQLEAEFMP